MPSIYIAVFVIIALCSMITLIKREWDDIFYYIGFVVLTLFLCLRYGQGTDYPGYLCIYETAGNVFLPGGSFEQYLYSIHGEIGWKILMVLFKAFDADFWIISMLIAIATMLCTHLGICRFCEKNRTVALMLIYPTVYLTYYFSGMRQGLVMAAFFGVLLQKVIDKKYVQFLMGVFVLSTIHKASVIYLIVPVILILSKRVYAWGTILSVLSSIVMFLDPLRKVLKMLASMIGVSGNYFGEPMISWFSLLERLIMLGMITLLVWDVRKDKRIIQKAKPLLKIYYFAFLVYIALITNMLVASRLAIMFKMAEILLIPMLICEAKRTRKIVFAGTMLICAAMTYKNLNSYTSGYYEGISGYNYPYVTIFNQTDILQYREEFVNDDYNFRESDYLK